MDTKLLQGSPFRPLILASAAILVGVAAADASQAVPPSVTVRYHDLNLNSVDGASALYRRMRAGAREVCGVAGRSLREQQLWQACFDDALARAVATVNNPVLTGVHTRASRKTA